MGFSWAVYLAQKATPASVVETTSIAESELFHDRQVNLGVEHGPRAFEFFDNIAVIGKDREDVDRVSRALLARPADARALPRVAVLRHLGDRTGW